MEGGIIIRKVDLSMNEQNKYEVIKSLADHPDASKERASLQLGVSVRHINRMLAGYREKGKSFFVHGNKGRKPATTISEVTRNSVITLYNTKYYDANFAHFTELLDKHEGISISESSVRSILESAGIYSPKITKHKKKRIQEELQAKKEAATSQKEADSIQANIVALEDAHSRHPRATYFGELIQMDASSSEWVPDEIWHLHLAIDDATSRVVGAWFDTQETLDGYYHVFHQTLTTYGIPYSFLTDRRTVFTYKKKNSPSIDEDTYTQFAYACKQLGVKLDSTSVPQAKGRVERLNQTLQSRLPIELRLAGITTIDSANEFLNSYIKEFNEKFALPLNGIKSCFEVQPSMEKINLILAVLSERTVDSGHSIKYHNDYYRMTDTAGAQVHFRKGTKVIVIQAFDKELFCCVNDKDVYALEIIPQHEEKSKALDVDYVEPVPKKKYIPPMSHPWRQYAFTQFIKQQKHHQEAGKQSA